MKHSMWKQYIDRRKPPHEQSTESPRQTTIKPNQGDHGQHRAAKSLPNYCKLKITINSMYAIEGLTKHLEEWEDTGWIELKNVVFFKQATYLLKRRSALILSNG